MAFGKPKYGNEGRKSIKSPKDGTTRVRILPPILSCEKNGKWSVQHKQHFGYATPRADDPQKKNWNCFYCVEVFNFKTKTTEQECPECALIKEHKDLRDSTRKALEAKGRSKDEIAKSLEGVNDWLSNHNLDNKHYMNVKTPEGEFFTFKVPYTVKEKITSLVEEYRNPKNPGQKPVDAIDADQGLWFDVIRKGKGFNTEYDVRIGMDSKTVDVDGVATQVQVIKLAPLTEEDANQAEESCYDLMDVGIRRISPEKVALLVQASEFEEIDAIFSAPDRERSKERSASPLTAVRPPLKAPNGLPNPYADDVRKAPPAVVETPANSPVDLGARSPAPAPAVDDEEAALLAQMAALKARKAAATAKAQADAQAAAEASVSKETAEARVDALVEVAAKLQAAPAPSLVPSGPVPANLSSMSDADFFARFKKKTP